MTAAKLPTSGGATRFPKWLDRFVPDVPHRKAAFCAQYRELLADDDAFLVATTILWGGCWWRDEARLESLFAHILLIEFGVRWWEHPLCPSNMRGLLSIKNTRVYGGAE